MIGHEENNMHVDYTAIGMRIKAKRKARNMTQERLAEALGVTVGYVSQIERGVTKASLDFLAAVATTLHCDLAELVSGTAKGTQEYLSFEAATQFGQLTDREKRLTLAFIQMLLENRS